MRQWQQANPKVKTNASEQGSLSGLAWKALTAEQKQPYIDRAQQDKQRALYEYHSRRDSTASSHDDSEQLPTDTAAAEGSAATAVASQSGEEKSASGKVTKAARKAALAKVEAVEEEFSELSPALSSRRPSDPSVPSLTAATSPASGRRAVAISEAPWMTPRPITAMHMFINDAADRAMKAASDTGVKLLKGDAKRAARSQWARMTDAEKEVISETQPQTNSAHSSVGCSALSTLCVLCTEHSLG